ncbi:MAG: MotA/TolQ/ExbB proton channel family protein [Spirochaetales bacterium]|nr:MotA/TolQ/ExbB proton channel family protein [Spirochaetales bacterium]
MKFFYFTVIIVFAVLLFLTCWVAAGIDSVGIFIDPPSAMLVILCSLVLLLANYSLRDIRKHFAMGFKKENFDSTDLKNGIVFFSALQKYLLLSGMMGTFIGMIAMLAMLDDTAKIGRALSLSLLTALYAIILSMVVAVPFKAGLQKRLNEITK